MRAMNQPKTGARCGCKRGVQRDNCPNCEGTGWVIDFRAIRTAALAHPREWYEDNPPDTWEDCGCCECYHPPGFTGDCRQDDARWPDSHAIAAIQAGRYGAAR